MRSEIKEFLEFSGAPESLRVECSSLSGRKQGAIARLLNFEMNGGDGFALRRASEMDLYQFDYQLNALLSKLLALRYPAPTAVGAASAFQFDGSVDHEVRSLEENGYAMSPHRLSHDARTAVLNALGRFDYGPNGATSGLQRGEDLLSAANGGRTQWEDATFWLKDMNAAVHDPVLSSLAFDPYIISVVSQYLGCSPIHVQTNAWFSFAGSGNAAQLSSSAQLYHQDKEYSKFLKVFVYLNDVGADNGPHCYIEGSHVDELFKKGIPLSTRLSDSEIVKYYSPTRLRTVTGPAGSIMFGDTSAVHKGSPVIRGHRIMLQFEYATSLYLSPVEPFDSFDARHSVQLSHVPERCFANYDSAARKRFFAAPKPGFADRAVNLVRRLMFKWRHFAA